MSESPSLKIRNRTLLLFFLLAFHGGRQIAAGITVENAAPVIAAGADFLAVSAGVWAHKDGPRAAVARFNALLGA